MKNMEFNVPVESMVDFTNIIEEHELANSIQGVNEDEEIIVKVGYEPDEREVIMDIIELLETEDDDDEEDE
jgi:hypothetical protein